MKYISLKNSVQLVYQKNIIITLSFAINEPGIKTGCVFQVDSFNELRKLQQLYKCKKCGYRNVKSRSIEQNKMESRTKQLLFSFFVLVFCKYFL